MADEKRYDATKILGRASGLGEDEVRRIFREVRANSDRLAACPGPHDFQGPEERIGAHFTCTVCGGTVPAIQASWYRRGLEHGRKQAGGS